MRKIDILMQIKNKYDDFNGKDEIQENNVKVEITDIYAEYFADEVYNALKILIHLLTLNGVSKDVVLQELEEALIEEMKNKNENEKLY